MCFTLFETDPELRERAGTLERTLRGLDGHQLGALIAGLEKHGDELRPGRLYAGSDGGCVVGVMLRELHPAAYGRWFKIRHGWRPTVNAYGARWSRNPRLWHLERLFDDTVERLMQLHLPLAEASRAAGAWFLTRARLEGQWREIGHAFVDARDATRIGGSLRPRPISSYRQVAIPEYPEAPVVPAARATRREGGSDIDRASETSAPEPLALSR